MNEESLSMFTPEALALVSSPGGYEAEYAFDPVTEAPMSLQDAEVPLALGDYILGAHSDAVVARGSGMQGWEATLASLACDLIVRCERLEQRLAERS